MKHSIKKRFYAPALFIALCVFMTSCKGEDFETSSINYIDAVVENGSVFDSRIDKVVVYTQTNYQAAVAVYENGRFTIDLPETIESRYLREVFTEQPGLQVSSRDAMGIGVRLFAYQSDNRVGEFFYAKSTGIPTEALFVYVDRDVRITGRQLTEWDNTHFPNPNPIIFFTHINYHEISLKRGWNIIYFNETSSQEGQRITTTEVINTRTPEGLRWHFNGPGERTFQPKRFRPSFPIPNTMRIERPINLY